MKNNDRDSLLIAATSPSTAPENPDGEFDLRSLFAGLKRRKKSMAMVAAGVFVVGMVYTVVQRPVYESTARLLVSPSRRPGLSLSSSIGMPTDMRSLFGSKSAETEVQLLSDDQLVQAAYNSLSKRERETAFDGEKEPPEGSVGVSSKQSTDVVEVTVVSHSPTASAHLANAIVKNYFDKDFDENSTATRKARKYAESRMRFINRQLADANKKLAEFKERNHLVALDAQLEKFTAYSVNLQTELDAAMTQKSASAREAATLEQQINRQTPNVVSGDIVSQNPRFTAVASRLDALNGQRIQMLQEFRPQSPEIRALDSQIRQEESRLKQTAQNITESVTHSRNQIRDNLTTSYAAALAKKAAAEASAGALRRTLAVQSKAADAMPEKERVFSELQGDVDMLGRAYGVISDQYYGLLLTEQQNVPRAQVVAQAIPDDRPVSGGLAKKAVMFMVLGAVVGLISALIGEAMDKRIRDPQRAEEICGCVGSTLIPMASGGASPFIARSRPAGEMLGSFRVLRNRIYFAGIERRLKALAVTSPGMDEGKTLTCANLAAVMAMDGKKVVVVDCNMEHPTIREFIGRHDYGLTDVLGGDCTLEKAIAQSEQENVFLLPAGPAVWNFPELLNSEKSRSTFARLGELFDYVLIDSPSVASLADLQVISTLADGVLLVVRLEKTLAPDLAAASHTLSRFGIPFAGLVVNGHETGDTGADAANAGRSVDQAAGKSTIAARK